MFEHRVEKLPIVDAQNRVVGLVTMRDLKLHKQKPYSTKEARGRLRVGAAIGATGDYAERAAALVEREVDVLLLDVAHADSDGVAAAVAELRRRLAGRVPLVVGNVATSDGARRLCDIGADAIKVGVGPAAAAAHASRRGRRAQLQAVRECYLAVSGRCRSSRTAACATTRTCSSRSLRRVTVMLGSLLSGTDEAPGSSSRTRPRGRR